MTPSESVVLPDLQDLETRFRFRRRQLDQEAGVIASLQKRITDLDAEMATLEHQAVVLEQTTALLNSLGEERQAVAQTTIEDLVTQGLQSIFDPTLSFHIATTVKGKTTTVEFFVKTTLASGSIETPVIDARGGGLVAVISFLLRLTVLLLQRGRGDHLLVLDESFAMVSEDYLDNVGSFLKQLVERTGVQIIMVTHQQTLVEYADVVYRFSLEDGETKVRTE
jgi:DNA repair exonuclease SbcCD ATPase subunit